MTDTPDWIFFLICKVNDNDNDNDVNDGRQVRRIYIYMLLNDFESMWFQLNVACNITMIA